MIRTIFLCLVGLAASIALRAEQTEQTELPFSWPAPPEWRTETIPFPLGFAPELKYAGLEEVRFSPGMFDPGSEQHFSYAFLWWLEPGMELSAKQLEGDLEAYFEGLSRSVANGQGFEIGPVEFAAQLRELEVKEAGRRHLSGTVQAYDPFATRKAVKLNTRIEIFACPGKGQVVAYFSLSPQIDSHPIWQALKTVRQSFSCSPSG